MASINKPLEPSPASDEQEEEESTSDEAEDDDDDEDDNNFHISATPSAPSELPLLLRNQCQQPTSSSSSSLLLRNQSQQPTSPPPLIQSSSRALIPFTGSFPAIPSPSPLSSKPAIVASHDGPPAIKASADIHPRFDGPLPQAQPDGKLAAKASSFDADPEPDKKGEAREHKKRSKNWTRPETLTLIRLRTELAPRFAKAGRKSDLWDEIAESLQKGLFCRDAQQCRDKWEKLMAGYKEVRDGVKHKDDNPYYEDLYPLLSGRTPKREREPDATIDYPPAKAEPSKTSTAMDAQIHHPHQYQPFKTLSVDGHHSQPFKTLVIEGHHHHQPSFKTPARDVHHPHPSLRTLAMAGHLHQPSFETPARDGYQQGPLRGSHMQGDHQGSMAMDNHAAPADDDDASEEKSHTRKQRKGTKVLSVTDLHAVQSLLESIITRQQSFFKELLDGIEKKEELREQMRQEREEKWRAEERAQRHFFTEAMQILSQKLGGINGVVQPSMVSAAAPHSTNHVPPVCSPIAENLGPKRRSKNWKRSEVLQLIKLRGEMEDKFAKSARRVALWGELAEVLSTLGIRRDGKQCREKWDKLMAEYKDVLDGKKEKGDSPYYPELQIALAGGGGPDMQGDVCMSGVSPKQDEMHI